MTLMNYKQLEEILPKDDFVRVQKSYLVAISKIDFVERSHIIIKDERIPIGDAYRSHFFKIIGYQSEL
jgi:two-component system, LytTR family, response regulator